jgi:hypothetical protein
MTKVSDGGKAIRSGIMHRISREEADDLIERWEVLDSLVAREPSRLMVQFNLSNHQALKVYYDLHERVKSYFIDESGIPQGPVKNIPL